MIDHAALKDLLQRRDLSRRDKILALIGAAGGTDVTAQEVRRRASAAGLRAVKDWDLSSAIRSSGGGAVFTGKGWDLNSTGISRLEQLFGPIGGPARKAAVDLRSATAGINSTAV